ncbi:MAG TPA: protein kinase, partial [Candidatus Eisenbacteria bacterium]|nr:protein kinase [Candidatus Eisenbacteria bacterium]
LPSALTGDPERLARFDREARLLAAMSHPGIAGIHGIEDGSGARGLVMELVDGETLAERIVRGPVPADEALPMARQIAEALEYAHDRGIIHRDLKPANVKLRSDGTAKVLDFGLARALDAGGVALSSDLTQSPTITQRMTQAGMILGTAAYMSPEQARGREADRRADIWAFGAVLYEMLTGQRAFGGETISETLASVMRDDPDWSRLPRGLSPRWERLIRRCLTKDPKQRLQAIGEARIALEDIGARPEDDSVLTPAGSAAPGVAPSVAPKRRLTLASLAPWLLAAIAGMAAMKILGPQPSPPVVREVSIVPPHGETFGNQNSLPFFAISPDARMLAYTVRKEGLLRLHLRRFDQRSDVEVSSLESPRSFFFSRDGEWLGFFDRRHLSKISLRGGTPEDLAETEQERLGTWLDDGTIVYAPETTSPLYRISETGGQATAITALDSTKRERTHRYPSALDGGPWVVFTVGTIDSPGDYDAATIDAVSVKTGERRQLIRGARCAAWAPPGHLVFARGNDLYAVPIDPRNPRISQKPLPVLQGVSGDRSSGASFFSIADDGTLAWEPAAEQQRIREIGWFDRKGQWTPTPLPPGEYLRLSLSPDGTRAIVLAGQGGGASDLWLADLATGGMQRLTYGNRSGPAVWLPDGQRFAYTANDSTGGTVLALRRVDSAGGERILLRLRHPLVVMGTTSDGRFVLWNDYGLGNNQLHVSSTDTADQVRDLPSEAGDEQAASLSPDQQWLAVISNRTKREEVCVRRFSGTGSSWQVTTTGAGGVRWGREGRELFYVNAEKLFRVSVEARGQDLVLGKPEGLFDVPPSPIEGSVRDYAYDPQTDRFLFTRPPHGVVERREIALSLRWTSRLPELLKSKQGAP